MSDWYDIHGRRMADPSAWSNDRENPDSDWQKAHRRTAVPEADAEVSTVWISLDHSFGEGPPLIFETLIFGGGLDGDMERYSTLEAAHAGHEAVVQRVKAEAAAFKALAEDRELIASARHVKAALDAHNATFDIGDYEGKSFDRLMTALTTEVQS